MTPKDQFDVNIAAARHYVQMYKELRRLKGLGARGVLDANNRYLLWLPRGAIISAMSSLDAYVHQVLFDRIPKLLEDQNHAISDSLAELVLRVMPVKKADSARDALVFVRATSGPHLLGEKIKNEALKFEAYQAPDKVDKAFQLLNCPNIFEQCAAAWPGPNVTGGRLKDKLSQYYRRRNQIAHEGDIDRRYEPRAITPNYGTECTDFIDNLVRRMDGAIYP